MERVPRLTNTICEGNKTKDQENNSGLFFIQENNGSYKVVLPGGYYKDSIIPGYREFDSKEDAEIAVTESREDYRIFKEKHSLEKGFSTFNSILEKDGSFEVVLPGLLDMEKNITVGGSRYQFDNWNDAKRYYLKYMESREKITTEPILELTLNNFERIAFSDFENFNPIVAPRKKSREIPQAVKKSVLDNESSWGDYTYQKTIENQEWNKELFNFIQKYLETGDGQAIIEKLEIEHLNLLSPRQSIELTSQIILMLTKYNQKESDDGTMGETNSDKMTALDILKNGLENKDNQSWQGNGICRNFASTTKAVFESLKNHQEEYNFLRDTYCIYNAEMKNIYTQKKLENKNSTKIVENRDHGGHAWNTFITLNNRESNSVVIDTTWGKLNLDTGEIEDLDYTTRRTDEIVSNLIKKIEETDQGMNSEQVQQITNYNANKMEFSNGDEKAQNCLEFIRFIKKNFKEDINFPKEIIQSITGTYGYSSLAENADPSEIEILYKISKNNNSLPFDFILDNYLKNKDISSYWAGKLIFKDDLLQRKVLRKIKDHPQFENLVNSSPEFKNRIENL